MAFHNLFSNTKPVLAVIHLEALPGAPYYRGDLEAIYDKALSEAHQFMKGGVDGLIIENFKDIPFYPKRVPAETVAAMAGISRQILCESKLPIGINVLRNDGESAMAIAASVNAHFIRVNAHLGAIVSEQGIIEGCGHLTTRLRQSLSSKTLIFADVGVKHASPLGDRGLETEAIDLTERGLADALIVSGARTGSETSLKDIETIRKASDLPLLIGSGATPENIPHVYNHVSGFIVGSFFKHNGNANNPLDCERLDGFLSTMKRLQNT